MLISENRLAYSMLGAFADIFFADMANGNGNW
jgi:hypothetical protein